MILTREKKTELIERLLAVSQEIAPRAGDTLNDGVPLQVAQGMIDAAIRLIGGVS